MTRCLAVLILSSALSTAALAADKKAESELRFALNACGQVMKTLERAKGMSGEHASQTVLKAEEDYRRFQSLVEKAKAIDASVVTSTTVFNKKDNVTFAQMLEQCLPLAKEFDAARGQLAAADTAKEEKKTQAAAERGAQVKKGDALDQVTSAIKRCAIIRKWKSSSGMDQELASYAQEKKAGLDLLPAVAQEKVTATLIDASGGEAETTKTVAEWFTSCDALMPEQLAKVRADEKAAAAAERAETARRNAMDDRIRAEQDAKYKALLATVGGDRKRILQSKGFLPHWPRGGDLKSAPVWRWERNITGEPNRCETYQFGGETLKSQSTALGGCG